MSPEQEKTLRAVYEHPRSTVADLGEVLGLSYVAVQNRVRSLRAAGWVTLERPLRQRATGRLVVVPVWPATARTAAGEALVLVQLSPPPEEGSWWWQRVPCAS